MARIVAVEGDSNRQAALTALLADHVNAELIIVPSVREAVSSFAERVPDVVLAPTLLSPSDEITLVGAVRDLDAAHVQMLNVPAIDLAPAESRQKPRRLPFARRAAVTAGLPDASILIAIVADGLARAREIRDEIDAAEAHAAWRAERGCEPIEVVAGIGAVREAVQAENRRKAERVPRAGVPWISAVRMPWDLDIDLVNISSTGILLESGTKLPTGVTYELRLEAPEAMMVVKARVVRAAVSRMDRRGVRYHLAAAFERQLDLRGRRSSGPAITPSQALTDLLAAVVADGANEQESAHLRFARGVRQLVRARDVLVRRTPITPADGSESIYFHVSGEGQSRTILQVLFDPDRAPSATEISLLKAAAAMANALQQLESCGQPNYLLTESNEKVA